MTVSQPNVAGLTSAEAKRLQDLYGKNELSPQKKETFFQKAFHILCEPMFLLLIAAAIIYFILGEPRDGAIMLIFVVGIISIDVIQEWKTDQTLHALKDLSAPQITVIRDGNEQRIASADLVPGDLMMICEGVKIPADGVVLRCATCAWMNPLSPAKRRASGKLPREAPNPQRITGARITAMPAPWLRRAPLSFRWIKLAHRPNTEKSVLAWPPRRRRIPRCKSRPASW